MGSMSRGFPRYCATLAVFLIACLAVFVVVQPASAQSSTPTPTATQPPVSILSPLPGQALQGTVPIQARIDVKDVQSVELTFGYTRDPTQTWFLISQSDGPVTGKKLADWDTTTLTDGNYTLRLIVIRQDGSRFSARVTGLRVRNYSPIETDTPTPSLTPPPGKTPLPTVTPTPSSTPVYPTPTPLPANPLQMSFQDVSSGLLRGAVGAVAFFAFLGLYGSIRRRLGR